MKVSKIEISNILGIVEMQIEPGKVTRITGRNGSGKTSIMEAIKASLRGGNQAELLRQGEEQGEIVLVLDNGMRITKSITPGETKLTVSNENGRISKPMDIIKNLSDALSVNPVDFLTAEPKDRADYLLEALPLELDKEAVLNILPDDFIMPDLKKHALKVLEEIHNMIFSRRQDINRTMKEKTATIEQLKLSVPKSIPGPELKTKIEEMEAQRDKIRDENADRTKKANDEFSERNKIVADEKTKLTQALQAEYDEKLKALNKLKADTLEEINAKLKQAEDESKKVKDDLISSISSEHAEKFAQLGEEITKSRQILEDATKHQNTANVIDGMKKDYDRLEVKSNLLSIRLDSLKEYKGNLLKNLPISGIEVLDGMIFRNGVRFDTLNTAQQIEIAVELGKLRAKTLGLICLDGAERLDSERFAALEEAISKTDLQIIMTKVSDEPLMVEIKA